jgi:hypothetical protein
MNYKFIFLTLTGLMLQVPVERGTAMAKLNPKPEPNVRFEVVSGGELLLHRDMPICKDNLPYGFEGGRIVKAGGTYHWITTEIMADEQHYGVLTRLAHWTSANGNDWQRQSTIRESDGDFTGTSQRAAIWGPMMVFIKEENRWHLFYVCYKCGPKVPWHDAVIQHAVSDVAGQGGIGGPYTDKEILMRYENGNPDAWEGGETGMSQSVDSFFPYKIGKKWYAFYGSATISPKIVYGNWKVGLATADKIEGPWVRMSKQNPVDMKNSAENPIVYQLEKNIYIAIFDGLSGGMGYSLSRDGVNWSAFHRFDIEPKVERWWNSLRTPLSFIKESDGTYTMYFTAFQSDNKRFSFGALSKVKLKMIRE